jgi:hypothetical protein
MAPVLQCPDCGTKHPLASIGEVSAFPCSGCGRRLKVPPQARATTPAPSTSESVAAPSIPEPVAAPALDVAATTALPPVAGPVAAGPTVVPGRLAPVRWWTRLVLWIVAVPVSFLIVFSGARLIGVFTSSQLTDLFLGNDSSRFWPVARLLPFVAVLIALLVHTGVVLLARRGRSRHRQGSTTRGSDDARQPSTRTRRS